MSEYSLVITTAANREEAAAIASALLEQKLVACVQLQTIESLYTWKGEVANEPEVLMFIKTSHKHYDEVETTIKKVHSYETPEVIEISIERGSKEYLDWIDEVT